jgi:outer membrane protein insertion porin family
MIYRNILLAVLVCFSFAAYGQSVRSVVIQGNERIEDSTIKSYLDITPGVNFTADDLDSSIKKLYASNLFRKVDIFPKGDTLYVKVIENPKLNLVVFEGNSKIKSKELEVEISLKPRAIYTKAKVQEDVNRIIDLYVKNGRFSAKVIPQIIALPQNRVNLIFKIEEGPVAKIDKIKFIGNNAFGDNRLLSEVSSKETHWYYFLSSSDQFNPIRLEYDRELLSRFYSSRGYADFKIISVITSVSENKERFFITITLDEGKKYKFGKVDVVSQLKTDRLSVDDLKSEITTKTKDVYDVRKIDRSIDLMVKKINDLGYAFVDINPQVTLDNEKQEANITYYIGESRKVYINRINIKGNVRTSDKVIRREFRIAEGDPYNSTKIDRSDKRINNLNFFEPTHIETARTEEVDKVNLNVDVQEKSTTSLNFAGGYSTSEGPIGKVGLNEENLFGKGQQFGMSFSKAQRRLDADMSFTEPYMFDRPLAGGFDLFTRSLAGDNRQYRSYDSKSKGVVLRSGYEVTEYLRHSVHYELSQSDISNVSSNSSVNIQDQAGKRVKSLIGQSFSYDRRDKTVGPTEGYILAVSQDYAGLGGSDKFLRYGAQGRYYYPVINDDVILMVSADAGYIQGIYGKNVNISDRFSLGGADSLRGFDYGGVGPRAIDQYNSSLGGNIYYTGTTELKFPLGFGKEMGLYGSTFVDAGSLYHVDNYQSSQVLDSKKIRASYGVGIGFVTPVGPVRLHYAVPFRKTSFDQTQYFDISFQTNF